MPRIQVGDVQINYVESGKGDVLLFLQAGVASMPWLDRQEFSDAALVVYWLEADVRARGPHGEDVQDHSTHSLLLHMLSCPLRHVTTPNALTFAPTASSPHPGHFQSKGNQGLFTPFVRSSVQSN